LKYPTLFEAVCALSPVPRAQWEKAEALGKERAFEEGEHFLRAEDPADRFGLVIEGVFRAYRVSPGGEESIKAFRAEGEMIGAYAEMLQGIPSLTFIQALEDARALVFRTVDMQELEAGHPSWSAVARRVAEHQFILKERREQEFLDLSAEDRLVRFQAENPHLEGRLAQRDIAAYLGITAVALSRIVSRRRRRGRP
jgi:CRP-like cAMP-binding protein